MINKQAVADGIMVLGLVFIVIAIATWGRS